MTVVLALFAAAVQAPLSPELREWRTDFSRHTVPLAEIVSGGPPKDGIPAIDRPRFETVSRAARWLSDREPVVVVEIGDDARAYPLQILMWHEIVNDAVGGEPVAVTYCPLCNTALAFDRRLDGRVLDFGTTGRLRHSDLVMYDRQTESWWQQATGEGIVGTYAGKQLRFIAAPVTSWRDFRETYPAGRVLSRNTGHDRPYGRNPYEGYDTRRSPIAVFFRGEPDGRLPAMERVVALEAGGRSVAYAFSLLARRRVINDDVGALRVVVAWAPGTASAVDAATVQDGRDVGATAVFDRLLEGRVLSFEPAGDGRFRDRETGSIWLLSGRAVEGPLAGRRLDPVPHGNHFWFAWAVFRPDTRLVK
ncbi:MAG: DUF3179 domain-containing protein [Gemmatimonadales bacterium]